MGLMEMVQVKSIEKKNDDRGFFAEILRNDEEWLETFGQLSMTKTNPGIIKAFHAHQYQNDIWFVADGMARIMLVETTLLLNKTIYKCQREIFAGEDNHVVIYIPHGLYH